MSEIRGSSDLLNLLGKSNKKAHEDYRHLTGHAVDIRRSRVGVVVNARGIFEN